MINSSSTPRFYLVYCLDGPNKEAHRASLSEKHQQYIAEHKEQVVVGGPLLDDNGTQRVGSMMMVKFESREQVEEWIRQEPYCAGGVFESVLIRLFESRVFEPTLLKEE